MSLQGSRGWGVGRPRGEKGRLLSECPPVSSRNLTVSPAAVYTPAHSWAFEACRRAWAGLAEAVSLKLQRGPQTWSLL